MMSHVLVIILLLKRLAEKQLWERGMHVTEKEYQRMPTTFETNFWKGKVQNRISPVKLGRGWGWEGK